MDVTFKYESVMLVDDNEIDNLINHKMIESTGFAERIFSHSGARSAIEFLQNIERMPGANLPDIIFLDIDMPLMDGFQFLEEFEKLSEQIRSSCKIIMLTSSLNPEDLKRSKSNKYVKDYINKPLSAETLKRITV